MKKRGIVSDYLPWILIALAVLTILMVAIMTMRETGIGFIDKFKDLLRG